VVKVTPSGVEVQLALFEGPIRPEGPELIRFDSNGKACDSRDIYKGSMEWSGIPGTFEGGPWELADISAEERAAFERAARRKVGVGAGFRMKPSTSIWAGDRDIPVML
jgi:hypothetical protein